MIKQFVEDSMVWQRGSAEGVGMSLFKLSLCLSETRETTQIFLFCPPLTTEQCWVLVG